MRAGVGARVRSFGYPVLTLTLALSPQFSCSFRQADYDTSVSATTDSAGTLPLVTPDMRVHDIVTLFPPAADIMAEYGLHCSSCSIGGVETLSDGCAMHGYDQDDIAALVEDINAAMAVQPARPKTLTLTAEAARNIEAIAASEGRKGEGLAVIVDQNGGFCMEFRKEKDPDDGVFSNAEEPDVRIFASTLTLARIGGATIDFRDGRFKLDLPEDKAAQCGCTPETCGCTKK